MVDNVGCHVDLYSRVVLTTWFVYLCELVDFLQKQMMTAIATMQRRDVVTIEPITIPAIAPVERDRAV